MQPLFPTETKAAYKKLVRAKPLTIFYIKNLLGRSSYTLWQVHSIQIRVSDEHYKKHSLLNLEIINLIMTLKMKLILIL